MKVDRSSSLKGVTCSVAESGDRRSYVKDEQKVAKRDICKKIQIQILQSNKVGSVIIKLNIYNGEFDPGSG